MQTAMAHPLDNPIWESLCTHHTHLAVLSERAGRYPADIAPFVGVLSSDAPAAEQLEQLVQPGESVYLVAIAPPLGKAWKLKSHGSIPQMICESLIPAVEGPQITTLTPEHGADMLALTALVFPGYYRARTHEMGRYVGIYQDGVLAAMAGERMHAHGYQEISAVCTHPKYTGRRYAQRLIAKLTNDILQRGETPFLHVNRENARARAVYELLGYDVRRDIDLWSVTRV
jgi:GNAT superfamily N-acetyltransferase